VTVGEWLATRTPAPPERLARHVRETLGSALGRDVREGTAVLLDAAESLLRDLLASPAAGRERALDLLAVDALVTYAFEAASDGPATLGRRADEAMTRIAALAAEAQE
jgi:hypothetical protein